MMRSNHHLCRSEGSAKVLLADSTGFLSHPPPPWLSGPSHGRTPRTPTGSARAWMVHSGRTQRVLARGRPGSDRPGPARARQAPLTALPHSSDTRTTTIGPCTRPRQVSSLCAQSRLHTARTHTPHSTARTGRTMVRGVQRIRHSVPGPHRARLRTRIHAVFKAYLSCPCAKRGPESKPGRHHVVRYGQGRSSPSNQVPGARATAREGTSAGAARL